ncbi:hypothetical protein [Bradyrhizobium algeriense]|uniref:hypothetical protein n=1 Tax=Bradyrhizobium algeriense TaxID=634784 RepID=UPI001FCE5D05|nr:hypothetical protein [Bradyrhizobium algeriense]
MHSIAGDGSTTVSGGGVFHFAEQVRHEFPILPLTSDSTVETILHERGTKIVEEPTALRARRMTREELHRIVWERPMSRLAEEFGISGNGLAKVCDRLDVPYPPRGYWAKKEAGKPVVAFKLPPRKVGIPETADIHPSLPKLAPLPKAAQAAAEAVQQVADIVVPNDLGALHPRVQAWINDHAKKQKERDQENKRRRHDRWWTPPVIRDLTERDLYRFRVTSAIFFGVERAGGKIEKSPIVGKITFSIDGHNVECSIVEKMVKSLKQRDEQRNWTAYPDHHQSGLESSGCLRVSITTYLAGRQPQWIETDKTKIGKLLPDIVGAIIAAGPILEQAKREREEQQQRYREEEVRRYEARRLREIEEKRWSRFREFSSNWDERAKLLRFLTEIEARLVAEGDVIVEGRLLSDWVSWATVRAEALDPLKAGAASMFAAISKVTQWP